MPTCTGNLLFMVKLPQRTAWQNRTLLTESGIRALHERRVTTDEVEYFVYGIPDWSVAE